MKERVGDEKLIKPYMILQSNASYRPVPSNAVWILIRVVGCYDSIEQTDKVLRAREYLDLTLETGC